MADLSKTPKTNRRMKMKNKTTQTQISQLITDLARGDQGAEELTTEELKKIINESSATQAIRDDCARVLKSRKK